MRQAARQLDQPEAVRVHVAVQSDAAAAGDYPFALYRWQKRGVKVDETLIAVSTEVALEDAMMTLLSKATDAPEGAASDMTQFDALDARHHGKWSAAQANHIAGNRELVEHRIQSLIVSHSARCTLLEDQLAVATNDKIRLMRQGELTRAKADFERRLAELQRAAESGDIHATPVVMGVLTVRK